MKKLIPLLILLSSSVYAAEKKDKMENPQEYSSITKHNESYWIFGDNDDQAKVQFSLKYEIIRGYNFYIGYTQLMYWDLYDQSSPFRNIDFNPEAFWRFEPDWWILSSADFGFFEHLSNGKAGPTNRSLDQLYIETRNDVSVWRLQFAYGMKFKHRFNLASQNADIARYDGWFEGFVTLKLFTFVKGYTDSEEFEFRFSPSELGGWKEYGLKFRTLIPRFNPKFYFQIRDGFARNLLEYNQDETEYRFGVIFQ